ncbi:MAG: homoserine kinase [Gemmatimonadaceae bacterium]
MSTPRAVTVQAPGSIGNMGPGLDVLGCALTGASDSVTIAWSEERGITITDPGSSELPRDPGQHAAAVAAAAVCRRASARGGISIRVRKGLPLAGGQGGSAASAVAGAMAMNMLLGEPLARSDLLACCLDAEAAVAGRHLDNIAPSLLGGIVLVRSLDPIDVHQLPVPGALRIALALPEQRLRTAQARSALPAAVDRAVVVHQLAQVAAIVHALHAGDLALLGAAIDDRLAEPARAPLLPGFAEAKRAALDAGALGVSISGAGPTVFALCGDDLAARRCAAALAAAYEGGGIPCTTRVAEVDREGARVVPSEHA